MEEIKGYFMEDEIYWKGVKQKTQKTPLVVIDDNGGDTLHVLSLEGNWYKIKRDELISVKN